VFLIVGFAVPAFAEKRVALVIGNSSYSKLQALVNPRNDAQLMAKTLRNLGFEVVSAIDVDRIRIGRAIKAFGKALRAGGRDAVGLFYFAGHGVQSRGVNYLLPLGVDIQDEADLDIEAVSASNVLSQMRSAGNALNLVILDACRNNPFKGRLRSASRGLARIQAASGSLVAFAAAPGQAANDGRGGNSPYTKALVQAMAVPGLTVEQVFKRARVAVEKETGGSQTPWEESSLKGDFYFKPGKASKPAVVVQPPMSEAAQAWTAIQNTTSTAVLEAFIRRFGKSVYADFARAKLIELKKNKVAIGVFPKKPPVSKPAPRSIVIGTGSPTGIFHQVGRAVCGLVNADSSSHGIKCDFRNKRGSIGSLRAIRKGEIDFGVVQSDWQRHAYLGSHSRLFPSAFKNLRSVFSLYPYPLTLVARKNARIRRFSELKGKRVNLGTPGSGARGVMEMIMRKMGWRKNIFALAAELKTFEAPRALCDGKIDAFIMTISYPHKLIDRVLNSCGAHLVQIDIAAARALVRENPSFAMVTIPAGAYRGMAKNITTIGVGATLVTSARMSENAVYELVKSVFDNLDRFKKMHSVFAYLRQANMIKKHLSAPLHPGALRYFRERGWK
jgi:TRAP transporter TAXI family solute receptor